MLARDSPSTSQSSMESIFSFPRDDFEKGVVVGVFTTLVVLIAAVIVPAVRSHDVYSLVHWKLHVQSPLRPLWMNIGFWTTAEGNRADTLEAACVALLREVLTTASLYPGDTKSAISIIDVGFGCGDQTWEIVRLLDASKRAMFQYTGITDNPKQVAFAQRRLDQELADSRTLPARSISLFHGDAAQPSNWDEELSSAVDGFVDEDNVWLLGLDCLYHFAPSRQPLFQYAARHVRANLMAFDLILNENATLASRVVVWCICKLIGCPTQTFLTKEQYAAQLEAAGYARDTIILRDVSSDVFPGFVAFMDAQEQVLAEYGIKLGALKVAKRIFGWFGTSGAIRAVIVVARVPNT